MTNLEDWKLQLALEFSVIQFNTLPWRVCQLPYSFDKDCQDEPLVQKIWELYEQISSHESLKPSKDVNIIFTKLVLTRMPPNPIDVTKLCKKLSLLEFNIISQHYTHVPSKIAFVGSGPLPLTSIVLASKHLPNTTFHNMILTLKPIHRLLAYSSDSDLSKRMFFHTNDIMNETNALKDYEVVFLAALVGMDKEDKVKFVDHLARYMAPGALLMLRSAHGARAFLYPVLDPCDLRGFEVLSVFPPTNEVINSVVIARKYAMPANPLEEGLGPIMLPIK
ncbi:nicotianamine synthase [Quercus suber]|uniref:Nicotianamine synthase n=1 Tax=Quercus suber TaxID=58331 RepID=A0AAW0KN65_QUESU